MFVLVLRWMEEVLHPLKIPEALGFRVFRVLGFGV